MNRELAIRLLVLDWVLVNRPIKAKADPAFAGRLEQASRERLATL